LKPFFFISPPTRVGRSVLRQGRCQIRLSPGVVSWPPLNLATLASRLREKGYGVQLLDAAEKGLNVASTVEDLASAKPSALVIPCTTPTLEDDLALCRNVKARLPDTATVVFGVHCTESPEEVVRGGADFAIVGEPEETLSDLADYLRAGEGKPPSAIPGLCFLSNGTIQRTEPRPFLPRLDDLPFPAWDLVNLDAYRMPIRETPFGVVEVARGCPYPCIFCTARLYHGRKGRYKSPERILEEIRILRERSGVRDFLFLADTFNLDRQFVIQLCQRIVSDSPGISWVSNSRVDRFDEEMASWMKRAGCWLVSFGIESSRPEVLEKAGKGQKDKDASRAVSLAKNAGIMTYGYYIFGLPGESRKSLLDTFRLARRLDTDFANFYTATPFPGTDLYRQAKKEGWLLPGDWDRYFHGSSDVLSLPGLPAKQLLRYATFARLAYYMRPRKTYSLMRLMIRHRRGVEVARAGISLLRSLLSG